MSYIRKPTVDTLSHEELLLLVKSGLDELGVSYEEKPGGFGPAQCLTLAYSYNIDSRKSVCRLKQALFHCVHAQHYNA